MTTDQIEQARALRAQGKFYYEIGEILGYSRSTVQYWIDPDANERQKKATKKWCAGRRIPLSGRCKAVLRDSVQYAKKNGIKSCNATAEQLSTAYQNQNGRCAICGILESACSVRLSADHDHETGDFRGWLCKACNVAMGAIDKTGIEKFVEYTGSTGNS